MIDTVKSFFGISTDERKLEPEGYTVQASSWPEVAGERILETVSSVAQKGVSSMEITLNHPESLTEHAVEEIKIFHEQEDVKVNIHASLDLRLAMAEKKSYRRVDEYMKGFIAKAKEIGADYINVHTSNFPSPELGRMRGIMYEVMVHPDGEPISKFVEERLMKRHSDSETFDWLVRDLRKKAGIPNDWWISEAISGDSGYLDKLISDKEVDEYYRAKKEDLQNQAKRLGRDPDEVDVSRQNAKEELKERYMSNRELIIKRFREMDDDFKLDVSRKAFENMINEGQVDLERIFNEFRTYQLIGWWMYEKGHPIWRKICGNRSPKDLEESKDMDLLVDAVAGRYIQGHVKNWKQALENSGVVVTLETPDARENEFLGYYRLVDPTRIYNVIKAIDHPNIKLCFDFEHIATQGINVKEILRKSPDGLGRETYLVHISSRPSPGHEHFPLQKGEIELYEMLWELKIRGFESGYITFERGGGQQTGEGDKIWKESISRAKEMAMFLEDEVSPSELPDWFYGYDDKEFKRDQAVIMSKTFEPLKGLIESPELEDTFLGKHAVEKEPRMRGDGWKKEEHQ